MVMRAWWSACMPSTWTIRVLIPLKSKVFDSLRIVCGKERGLTQKDAGIYLDEYIFSIFCAGIKMITSHLTEILLNPPKNHQKNIENVLLKIQQIKQILLNICFHKLAIASLFFGHIFITSWLKLFLHKNLAQIFGNFLAILKTSLFK